MTGESAQPNTFWGWIGFPMWKLYRRFPWIAGVIRIAFIIIILMFIGLSLTTFVEFFKALAIDRPDSTGETVRNFGLVLAAFLGAPIVLWRAYVAADQAGTALEEMITDRFNKAVEQLAAVRRVPCRIRKADGSMDSWEDEEPNIQHRLGGLLALERVAQDSLRDHIAVMETLCAYVRENAKQPSGGPVDAGGREWTCASSIVFPSQRADIQMAITIIGRRLPDRLEYERSRSFRLNLLDAALPHTDFENAKLGPTELSGADLRACYLAGAYLPNSFLHNVKFAQAQVLGMDISGSSVRGADFRGAANLTQAMIDSTFGVKSGYGLTLLPPGIEYPEHWHEAAESEQNTHEIEGRYYWHSNAWLQNFSSRKKNWD